jgi:hypothetical protein
VIGMTFQSSFVLRCKDAGSLPNTILNHRNDRKKFKNELSRYLLNNSYYTVKEFLEFSRDN